MKEYQLKHKTDWWKRMSEPPKGVGVFLCKPIQTFSLGLKMGGLYVDVRFLIQVFYKTIIFNLSSIVTVSPTSLLKIDCMKMLIVSPSNSLSNKMFCLGL